MNAESRFGIVASSALFGALAALALFPHARAIVGAQASLALGYRPEWMRAVYGGPAPRLARAAAAAPDDADLQVGAAAATSPAPGPPGATSIRLDELARRFPDNAAIRAHQLRFLTQSLVKIRRPDVDREWWPPHAVSKLEFRPPSPEALARFEAAASAGERLEPANGFFDTILAVGAFASRRDEEALRHLHAAAARPLWNDHAAEETRAQWKLLEAAYGDQGALQKIPVSGRIMLAHYASVRDAARAALVQAMQHERAGDYAGGQAIHRDVMQLGQRIFDGSPRAISKAVGLALFDLGTALPGLNSPAFWYQPAGAAYADRRQRFIAYLVAHGDTAEAAWVRAEGKREEALFAEAGRTSAGDRLFDAQKQLLAWWGFGLMLAKQMAVLFGLWIAVSLLAVYRVRWRGGGAPDSARAWPAIYLALFLGPCLVMSPFGDASLLCVAMRIGLVLAGLLALAQLAGGRRQNTEPPAEADAPDRQQPRWQLLLVALASTLPSAPILWLFAKLFGVGVADAPRLFALEAFAVFSGGLSHEPGIDFSPAVPVLVLVPAATLVFLVLCRVAALALPLGAGLVRGLRQAAPWAVALLVVTYLAVLVPTVAADRVATRGVELWLTDGLRSLEGSVPPGTMVRDAIRGNGRSVR